MQASLPPAPRRAPARNVALDGLRGIAVLLVFVFHYGGGLSSNKPLVHLLGIASEVGWTGVVLFFALSGFLITGSLWDSLSGPHLLRNFYARRALRILPLYYAALLLAFGVAVFRGVVFSGLHPFAIYALFLENIPPLVAPALNVPSPLPLYHLWSIAVEEQFYLLWPFLLLLAHRRTTGSKKLATLVLSLGVFGLAILFRIALFMPAHFSVALWTQPPAQPSPFNDFFLTQAGTLALGSALALFLRQPRLLNQRPIELHRWALVAFCVGLAVYLLVSLVCGNLYMSSPLQFILGLPAVSLAAVATIPLALHYGLPRQALSFAPLCWVGRISYGLYIFHVLLQPVVHHITVALLHTDVGSLYFGVRFVLALTISLLLAAASYFFFERPILSLKRHFPMQQPLP